MLLSILAGVMIGVGAIIYLTVGGVAGALLFAVGLMTVCHFQLHLFTGKAGLLATNEITPWELIKIWFGNLIGTITLAFLIYATPQQEAISKAATAIINTRLANGAIVNCILGICCGILMYIAVLGYKETKNMCFIFVPVAAFILGGFNHIVADFFYTAICNCWDQPAQLFFVSLLPTTIGNIIGCNIIPVCKKIQLPI